MKPVALLLTFIALQGCSSREVAGTDHSREVHPSARKIPYPKADRSLDAAADRFIPSAGGMKSPKKPADKCYVLSPYAPERGYIDVRRIPSGSRILCPFTGRVFRIP
jgi:hypothetical protein